MISFFFAKVFSFYENIRVRRIRFRSAQLILGHCDQDVQGIDIIYMSVYIYV